MQLGSDRIWVDLTVMGEDNEGELVCLGNVRSSLWDMLDVQLWIDGYIGLNIRKGPKLDS